MDYDCKKRKKAAGSVINDEELHQAEEKFDESKNQTEQAMNRLLSNEVEHITYLVGFAEGLLEYHSQCYEILKDMVKHLNERKKRVSAMPRDSIKTNGNGNHNGYNSSGGNSDGSSSASRFYDNSADTTSSLSDTFYADNNNATKQSPHLNGKPYPSNENFHKMPYPNHHQTQSVAPPVNLRSNC